MRYQDPRLRSLGSRLPLSSSNKNNKGGTKSQDTSVLYRRDIKWWLSNWLIWPYFTNVNMFQAALSPEFYLCSLVWSAMLCFMVYAVAQYCAIVKAVSEISAVSADLKPDIIC